MFLVNENYGDLILTKGFRQFVREQNFETIFCHKSDPQSKGKVENVVKYVKYNFLRGREFSDIDTLNKEVTGWLSRTANGGMHHGTRLIPSEEFIKEQEYLKPYVGTPELKEEKLIQHHVRKDNVITYRGNYYTVPTGTYHGHNSIVYIGNKASLYTQKTILEALSMCMDANIYNGCDLMNVAERIRINNKEELLKVISTDNEAVPSADTNNLIPEKTDINTFKSIFNEN